VAPLRPLPDTVIKLVARALPSSGLSNGFKIVASDVVKQVGMSLSQRESARR
jgi:hypothetical protein